MLHRLATSAKRQMQAVVLDRLAGSGSRATILTSGYTILLPTPQDMPFLLELALKNLLSLDLSHCQAIHVIPDGRAASVELLQQIVLAVNEPRVRLTPLNPLQTAWADRIPRRDGGANSRHWITIMVGLAHATTSHAFLHDIDAFLLDNSFVERQFQHAVNHGHSALGVTPRWDPFLQEHGISLPATWELLFAVDWARSHRPSAHKGGTRQWRQESRTFDTMLWPLYCDYHSNRIGVLPDVSSDDFVHFNGTITSYRTYQHLRTSGVDDELFRLLLLALWESAAATDVPRLLPTVSELARGLCEPSAKVTYQSPRCKKGYAEFRHMVTRLTSCACFGNEWRTQCETDLADFDAHFSFDPDAIYVAALDTGEMRETGLKQSTGRPATVVG